MYLLINHVKNNFIILMPITASALLGIKRIAIESAIILLNNTVISRFDAIAVLLSKRRRHEELKE
jgi:hypothetical protein